MKRFLCFLSACAIITATGCGTSVGKSSTGKTVKDVLATAKEDTSSAAPIQDSSSDVAKKKTDSSTAPKVIKNYGKADTDLSVMNNTMAYSEAVNICKDPKKYKDKIIKVKGKFGVSNDNGNTYFACLLVDQTACCSCAIEFELADKGLVYPGDYPELDSEITVIGKLDSYNEGESVYAQLKDAQFI